MDSVSGPSRVRFSGPLRPLAAGLAAELAALGYAPSTAEGHLRLAAHLSGWLQARGLGLSGLTGPVLTEFLVDRRREYRNLYSTQALGPTLGYLRRNGLAPAAEATIQSGAVEELLAGFKRYLLGERSVTVEVADAYLRCVRSFVETVAADDPALSFDRLDAALVTGFLVGHLPRLGRKTAQLTASALRSFLRFLHTEGTLPVDLATVVPAFAYRRQSGLPQPLTATQVEALVGACDPSGPVGRRDLAVIGCLLRLGLRCGEVAALRLEDIDWVDGTVRVHGKGNRIDLLPLPTDVGQALVAYLRHGRPPATSRVVFLTAVAPFTALNRTSVSCIVARAARRAGLGTIHAHRLRHTAASATLQRRGHFGTGRPPAPTRQPCHHGGVRQDRPDPPGHAGSALAHDREPVMTATMTELLGGYLRVRRALGYKLEYTGVLLQQFVAYLDEHDAHTITIEHALGFATAPNGASPRWQALRLSAIRCFARWAAASDPRMQVPPARLLPARPTRAAPYIYSPDQIRRLLAAAQELRPAIRAATFTTLIALMAATGIRTGEAIGLDVASLDRAAATLRVTGKYGKTRLLPLHPSVLDGLTAYLDTRSRLLPAAACPALLISSTGRRLPPSTVHPTFRAVVTTAGLEPASSVCRPRLHDLRHTFAVNTMLDAYRTGADPAAVLPILSTWLGHTEPRDTYWYLTGTSELLAAAADRLARHRTESR